jgi:hypothetical protein
MLKMFYINRGGETMSEHEKTAWWSLGSGVLIWLFLGMRFTEDWQIVDLPPGHAVGIYVQMINVFIVQLLAGEIYQDRTASLPGLDLGSTTAIVFALLTALFLGDAVKQTVILWQYRK